MRPGQCAPWPTGEAYQNWPQAHVSEIIARVNSTTHFCAVAEEMERDGGGPLLAGLRPSGPAVATSSTRLHLSLLRDLQRVVDLDSEVSDGALQFAMAKEKLDGPEIPGPPVDQCRFGT